MRSKTKWFFTLFMVFSFCFSFAQERNITGVVSEGSLPLPGVSVAVKGTDKSTQTDLDGKFQISAKQGDVLVFAFMGKKEKTATVGAGSVVNVALEDDDIQLDDVVVVAYGTQKREAIVGSVAVVSAADIDKRQSTSVLSALQGSVPGVNIITPGGVPGTNPEIYIRGINSVMGNRNPLIILDNAPYQGNLNSISQDQIASISVLKDGAATSLYGSRASSGVIIITTKKGKLNGAPQVTLNTKYGTSSNAVKMFNTVGAEDYMKYYWEATRNNFVDLGLDVTTAGQVASDNLISSLGYNPYNVATPIDATGNVAAGANLLWDTDWRKPLLRDTAIRTEHGLTINGGSENTTYFASVNYLKEEGQVMTTDFERITSRIKIDSKVNDWFSAGFTGGYATSTSNTPVQEGGSFGSAISWIYSMPNIYPLYSRNETGGLNLDSSGNPFYDYGNNPRLQSVNGTRPLMGGENGVGILYNNKVQNKRDDFNGTAYGEVSFTDHLKFKSTFSYQFYLLDGFEYNNNRFGAASTVEGRVSEVRDITKTMNAIQSLNYTNSFGKHNVNADLIYEAYQLNYETLRAQGIGFSDGISIIGGSTTPESVSGDRFNHTLVGLLGRAAYNYDNKYFVEVSGRQDKSSRFDRVERTGDFYSVGASWVISNENFMSSLDFVSNLKLRASYGEVGNDDVPGQYFPYLSLFGTGWSDVNPETGEQYPGIVLDNDTDPGLTWETTAKKNIAIDFGFFNNRLTGSVEYYNNKSIDLFAEKEVASSLGAGGQILTNIGSLKNYGWEFTLNGTIIKNDNFSWSSGLNFSMDRNEIVSLSLPRQIQGTKLWVPGNSLFDFYLQESAGVDPADGAQMWYTDVLDTDGNVTGRTTTKNYEDASRYDTGKSSLPDVIGGFNSSFQYKKWDLNFLFNFSYGGYIYDSTYAGLMGGFSGPGQSSTDISNRWQQPGDITNVPRLLNGSTDGNAQSDRFLFKNDYLRLKSLNFGYTFDAEALNNKLSNLRLYFQGDNLLTFASHDGIDPEQTVGGSTNNRSYQLKTFSFGIKATF